VSLWDFVPAGDPSGIASGGAVSAAVEGRPAFEVLSVAVSATREAGGVTMARPREEMKHLTADQLAGRHFPDTRSIHETLSTCNSSSENTCPKLPFEF
jgi:hypothetical protein